MGWLFGWIFDINSDLAFTACLSAVVVVFALIVGHWIWRWLSRRRTKAPSSMPARQVYIFGFVVWALLLAPVPIVVVEAVVWQNWAEPAQRSQARADADGLILAIESFRERTGRYPNTLDELVPVEIDRVPTQPDGNPFWYSTGGTEYTIKYKLPSRGLLATICSYSSAEGLDWWVCMD
jgi:hypothetical protein